MGLEEQGAAEVLLKLGQLAADEDFFLSENSADLLNGTFGFLGLGRAKQLMPFYPLATPGVYFRARTGDARRHPQQRPSLRSARSGNAARQGCSRWRVS